MDEDVFKTSSEIVNGTIDMTHNFLYEEKVWHDKRDVVDAIIDSIEELQCWKKVVMETRQK